MTMKFFGTGRDRTAALAKCAAGAHLIEFRSMADLHRRQAFRATAAICPRPLGRQTDQNGRKLTI